MFLVVVRLVVARSRRRVGLSRCLLVIVIFEVCCEVCSCSLLCNGMCSFLFVGVGVCCCSLFDVCRLAVS